jgi:hypothetical protein
MTDDTGSAVALAAPPEPPVPAEMPPPVTVPVTLLEAAISGTVDVYELDKATRGIGRALELAVITAAQKVRDQRTSEVGTEDLADTDVAPLVRVLMDAGDVLDRIGDDFKAAAARCRAEIAEEARTVGEPKAGENGIIPRLVVPDGDTEIIATQPTKKEKTWHPDRLASVAARIEVARAIEHPDEYKGLPDVEQPDAVIVGSELAAMRRSDYLAGVDVGVRRGFERVLELGRVEWRKTAVDAWKGALMANGEDALAGILNRALDEQQVPTGADIKVERDVFKPGRRR